MHYKVIGERNPTLYLYNDLNQIIYSIKTIGDPHLGKIFRSGISKNRLGEREELVYSTFNELMNPTDKINLIVIMGDLFDKTVISNECLNKTINIIEKACNNNPNTKYFILSGNHDFTKDKDKVSSFDLLIKYFNKYNLNNLKIIHELTQCFTIHKECLLYFSHYDPFISLDDELKPRPYGLNIDNIFSKTKLKIAFGHWDITDFSSISGTEKFIDRSVPKVIRDNFDLVFTGHEHKPKKDIIKGTKDIPVYITGSMQPYAFGEQLSTENNMYFSGTIDIINKVLEKDIDVFHTTNVRILYKKDETFPKTFKCLSRTYKCLDEPIVKSGNQSKTEVTNKDLNTDAELESKNEPLSFSKSFYNKLSEYKSDNLKDFIKRIEDSFTNKVYDKDW